MYLIGSNNHGKSSAWFIPKDFPRDALKKQDREKLLKFIDDENPKLQFTLVERWSYYFLTVLYPPISALYHL